MTKLKDLSLKELISPQGIQCETCGHQHAMAIKQVEVGEGVIAKLPQALVNLKMKKPLVICDDHTRQAAFPYFIDQLTDHKIDWQEANLGGGQVEPDERAVGSLAMLLGPDRDGIIAVGSGTLNDLGKVLAGVSHLPLITIATAPSMDGYGSNNASMIQNRLKKSLYYRCPEVIIADTRILSAAPMPMLQAGLGDMLAKYCSICEWRISQLVTGEYYCENIADLVRSSLNKVVASAGGLLDRDPKAVEEVFDGLLYTGLAMGFAGISRPASGLEHYFSHVWEMLNLARGKKPILHGLQVAVGTSQVLQIWDRLKKYQPDRGRAEAFIANFDEGAWAEMVMRIYGPEAGREVIKTAKAEGRNSREAWQERFSRIQECWPQILQIVEEELPRLEDMLSLMERLGLPTEPEDIGFSQRDCHDALIASREVRNKYVTSSLLWDLGLLYDMDFPFGSGLRGQGVSNA